jgi:hypothetical protein
MESMDLLDGFLGMGDVADVDIRRSCVKGNCKRREKVWEVAVEVEGTMKEEK